MKKMVFCIGAAAISAVAAVNVNLAKKEKFPDLTMLNIQALAGGENGGESGGPNWGGECSTEYKSGPIYWNITDLVGYFYERTCVPSIGFECEAGVVSEYTFLGTFGSFITYQCTGR
jgi:hypothetical protein